jgi:hypothetical protein
MAAAALPGSARAARRERLGRVLRSGAECRILGAMGGRVRRVAAVAALATAATLVALLLLELGFRLAGYQAIYEVYSKPSIFWQYDERLGWVHTPNAHGVYVGPRPWPVEFESPVRINSLGLRGPELGPREPGELRILLLGDSVAVGFEVVYEETFAALLERHLRLRLGRPVRVINAAVRAYGTDQSYLYYRERGHALGADLVLLVDSNNDPEDNVTLHRMRRPFGKGAFAVQPDASLRLQGVPVPSYPLCSAWRLSADFEPVRTDTAVQAALCGLETHFSDYSALFTFAALRIRQRPELLSRLYWLGGQRSARPPTADPRYRLTSLLILALGDEVRRRGGQFALLVEEGNSALYDLDAVSRAGIATWVLTSAVTPGTDPAAIRFRRDSHFNARGHAVVADFLEPRLSDLVEVRARREAGAAPSLR